MGDWSGDQWIIQSGLKAGDQVIVDGTARIFMPGAPVQVIDPKAAAEAAKAGAPGAGKAPAGAPGKAPEKK